MRYLLIVSFLFCSFISLGQDNVIFHHLNVENGLSQSSVLSITQDAKGFLWFGTRYGLNKYDSRTFKTYQSKDNDEHSLYSSESISSLLTAKNGSIWIGTSSGLSKYNEKNDNFDRIIYDQNNPNGISARTITCIYQDKKERIWIGTRKGLSLLLSEKEYKFKNYFTGQSLKYITAIYEDNTGLLWLGTNNGLFNLSFKGGKAFVKYFKSFNENLSKAIDNPITSIAQDSENNLWIGTKQTGLNKLNLKTLKITNYQYSSLNTNGIISNNIRKIMADKEGKLWIATLHGINIYNPATHSFSTLQNVPENRKSLSQNSVYDIYQDKQGIIWVGTYFGGINMIYPNYTPFKIYKSANTNDKLSSTVVSAIAEDVNQNLWIGTEAEGLNYFDRKNNSFTHYKYDPNNPKSIGSNLVKSIFRDKNKRIWVGTHLGGLNLFQPESNTFLRYTSKKNDSTSISSDEVTAVFEDSFGRFWVGTNKGLNLLNTKTGKFLHKKLNDQNFAISYIFEDYMHTIWLATNFGLYILKKDSDTFIDYATTRKRVNSLYSGINYITQDNRNNLFFGTEQQGVFKVDLKRNRYSLIDKKSGLPSNKILGILKDNQGNLWISTDNGLCKYNPYKKTANTYNIKDGLPGNEFNYKSVFKDSKGEYFFGGLSGLVSFFPDQIKENTEIPKTVITDLKLFNKPVLLNEENGLLQNNIGNTNSITFKSSQNVFSIDFAVLNFIKPNKNLYAYKLKGFEKNWNYVDIPSASYTNLSAGDYELLVKGSNNDGVWSTNPTSIKIKILPPFYKTWWAYLFYFAIVAAVLFILIRYLLIKAVLVKEKEINEHKLEFFTNISHEIRTPLTLIIAPLEKLISNNQHNQSLNNDLQPIKNNADRLLNLVTELLDFRKAESGKMALQVSQNNIVKFCKEIFLAFQNLAINNNIEYSFVSEKEDIALVFDKIQLEKVLFNLLSNAFKFTKKEGKITLSILETQNHVEIKIADNGKGIPIESQANLFSNFYQANPSSNIGTGLGLSLSKSIVELHFGEISFESFPETELTNGNTCFNILLQKGNAHFKPSDFLLEDTGFKFKSPVINTPVNTANFEIPNLKQSTEKQLPVLLLVEDNIEVRTFIKNSLKEAYTIYESEDGLQGWETAIELFPDLIISDVMMPNMDGLELCRKLKTDERTSHIPVILLTARSTYIHQVNGLETGADSYIVKPFNLKILQLNITNLLNAREVIKQKFANVATLEPKNLKINSTEHHFLNKIIQIIEDHIADVDFGVPVLASEVGMSQPILYKKIRALTDSSVNDFIKSIRLKKAAHLLKINEGNISEVAYSVGFSDRKYFSIEFKKLFGESPTEYKQKFNNTSE